MHRTVLRRRLLVLGCMAWSLVSLVSLVLLVLLSVLIQALTQSHSVRPSQEHPLLAAYLL